MINTNSPIPNLEDCEVAALLTGDIDKDVMEIASYREYIEKRMKDDRTKSKIN